MIHLKRIPKGPIEVLLTDGHNKACLAVARSLSRRGISFAVLTENPRCFALYSRAVKYLIHVPSVSDEKEAFLMATLESIQRLGIKLVIPLSDRTLFFFDQNRQIFSDLVKMAMPNTQAIRYVLNKSDNLKLARKLGIPCPRQFELKDPCQIPEMIHTLGFPVVMKNPDKFYETRVPPFEFRVLFVDNEEELRGHIQRYCQPGVYPLFQECVDGKVCQICCFADKGKIVAVHLFHSIRRVAGQGILMKIIPPNPELVEYASELLQVLNWDGIAQLEFFISNDRKKKWYMETNGRFWAGLQTSIHAGWDFPYYVYNYFLHGKIPEPGPIKLGSQTCWHYGDLIALINYWRKDISPTTGTEPGKFIALLQYCIDFNPAIHSDVFRWNDPQPALLEYWHLLERIIKK